MRWFKVLIKSISDSTAGKFFTGIGRGNEDVTNRSVIQPYGFTSLPPVDSVGLVIEDEENFALIGSAGDYSKPIVSTSKPVYIFYDENTNIEISSSGKITAQNNAGKIILNNDGSIELGEGVLRALMTDSIITKYNSHTHPDPASGSTGVPSVLFSPSDATQEVTAE